MKVWLLAAGVMFAQGCGDRLAQMQVQLAGTWVLQSRQLEDGTVLRPPDIQGAISWIPVSSRKAHVTLNLLERAKDKTPRRLNYAASTYEISTSAITQARHILIRQGYRSSALSPITVYPKEKKEKGKITVGAKGIEISQDNQAWIFQENTMIATYKNAWTDTWSRIQ
ncbi:MAG: hypothetical protein O3B73_08055 [bacterium]|jgi:hypothetical protein|nr:hypothetical protein [bacterium]